MRRRKIFKPAAGSLKDVADTLALGHRILDLTSMKPRVDIGKSRCAFFRRQALQDSQVSLTQPGAQHGLHTGALHVGLDRLPCATEVAAINGIEGFVREVVAEQFRLCESLVIEWAIQVALNAPLRVPNGLAMTNHHELCHFFQYALWQARSDCPNVRGCRICCLAFAWACC